MRSPKSRSRSKNNRNRSVGNIVNRVFDSSGPEGKVRGTPQQIIDKYNQLARDAQLGNDRVATENFQQHAEHYTRMLSEAQREADARREQQEQQNRDRDRPRDRGDGRAAGEEGSDQPASDPQAGGTSWPEPAARSAGTEPSDPPSMRSEEAAAPVDTSAAQSGSGLVETPENAEKPRRPRRARKPKPRDDAATDTSAGGDDKSGGTDDGAKQAAE